MDIFLVRADLNLIIIGFVTLLRHISKQEEDVSLFEYCIFQ